MSNVSKGRAWEEMIERSFHALDQCTVKKMVAPVRVVRWPGARPGRKNSGEFIGFFEKKGVCDFEGGFHGLVCSIEAKRTGAKRWPFSSISDHQLDRMRKTYSEQQGVAGVLLAWDHAAGPTAFFGIDFWRIQSWLDNGIKSVTPGDLLEACAIGGSGIVELRVGLIHGYAGVSLSKWLTTTRREQS